MIQNQKSSDMYFIEIKSTDKAHIQYTSYIMYKLYIYNVHTIYSAVNLDLPRGKIKRRSKSGFWLFTFYILIPNLGGRKWPR